MSRRTYLLNIGEKMPFCKIVILAKLLLCERSSSTVIKWEVPRLFKILINLLVDTIFFRTRRTIFAKYRGKKGKKTPFRKIVILAKLLLYEMSCSTVNKMRSHQALRNINHFIGGHNLFQTKRTYLLNKGEKTPFRKIVILEKLLLCEMSSSTVNNMRSHQTLRNIRDLKIPWTRW